MTPRKLRTFQTSLGFFDLVVISAPSIKAALEAWGSETNLFHQGFARETEDPAIVAAAIARPGVVLRRPVGSNAAFSEHAEVPKDLSTVEANRLHDQLIAKSPVTFTTNRPEGREREPEFPT